MKPPLPLLATVVLIITLLTSCDAPGEGPKSEVGKALGAQFATALEQFKVRNGHYPDSLMELLPAYATALDKELRKKANLRGVTFSYSRDGNDAYDLEFSYNGPGKNHCIYQRDSRPPSWECWGAY